MDESFQKKLDIMDKSASRSSALTTFPAWKDVRHAAIYAVDTLDLCWVAAQSVFQEKATAEHALAIYDRIQRRLEEIELQEMGENVD